MHAFVNVQFYIYPGDSQCSAEKRYNIITTTTTTTTTTNNNNNNNNNCEQDCIAASSGQ